MSDQNTKRTIIEEGSELTGTLKSNCAVVVSGKVNGEIHSPSLVVSEGGSVHGTIKVNDLKSQGEIAGQIDAEMVELSGKVNDQTIIRATMLEVKLSTPDSNKLQVQFGNCSLEVGKEEGSAPAAPAPAGGDAQPQNRPQQGGGGQQGGGQQGGGQQGGGQQGGQQKQKGRD
ncbi:MAG: polymer-forming cytoskeletal protein [Acidobacteria bacterium]|nr:polymer-forming cytoskeletal protein [Acidobacteriota bacterium]